MQRDFAWAAQTLADKNLNSLALATIDGSQHPDLVKSLGVDGYPALQIYRKGVHIGDHHGDRRHDKFVQVLMDEVANVKIGDAKKAGKEEL